MTSAVVLVGEMNPYGADPEFALYPYPRQASGNRLREILGLTDNEYIALRRINLCEGRWTKRAAMARAGVIIQDDSVTLIVMLGRKVATAFGRTYLDPFEIDGRFLALPHPSGRCRVWGEPGARERARRVWKEALAAKDTGEVG